MKIKLGLAGELGSALAMTVVISGVLGMGVASYLGLVNAQYKSVKRSQQWNSAIPVVEAGLEEAMTHVYYGGTSNLATNGWVFTNNAYWKQRFIGETYYSVAISNSNPQVIFSTGYVRVPGSTNFMRGRTVMLTGVMSGMFKGLVAKAGVSFAGQIQVDSFDSQDPNYSSGGVYNSAKNKDNGFVGAVNGSIDMGSQGKLWGAAGTGPLGWITNGVIGTKAWIAVNTSGVQAGHYANDLNLSFPDVTLPFALGSNYSPPSGAVGGTNYSMVFSNGNYQVASISMSGQSSMCINGNVTLLITNGFSMAGQSFIYLTPSSTFKVYVMAGSTSLSGNGIMNSSSDALKFQYYGMPNNTSVSLGGNAAFTGTIYAPQASFSMGGGGNNNYDCVGAVIANSVGANGHFNFHYDENVGKNGPKRGFVITAWNEI